MALSSKYLQWVFTAVMFMIVQPASAHWFQHQHPTQWAQVPHGVAHKHYDHRKGYRVRAHREQAKQFKAQHRNFWGKVKQFKFPTVGHQRLDFCYKNQRFCGRTAANAFCKMHGYAYATQFKADRHALKTRSIGNRRLHVYPKNHGNGFTYVRCRKHA